MTQDVDTDAIEEARKARKREYERAWRAANPDKVRETERAWRAANPDKVREMARAWREANPEKNREASRAWCARRITSDPVSYKCAIMLRSAKARSSLKNLAFDITIDDISTPMTCPVLGIELDWRNRVSASNSPSLDRIIPELGYVRGNVMVISNRANMIKSNATAEELKALVKYVEVGYKATEHLVNKNDTKDIANDVEN